MADVPRPPVITRVHALGWGAALSFGVAGSLLVGTLTPSASLPPGQQSQVIPVRAVSSQAALLADSGRNTNVITIVPGTPGRQLDWPNPTLARPSIHALIAKDGVGRNTVALTTAPADPLTGRSRWDSPRPAYARPPWAAIWSQWQVGPNTPPPTLAPRVVGYPILPERLSNTDEHRREIVRHVNAIRQGKQNVTKELTLTAGATATTLTDARIGYSSAIIPAMPTTANAAAAMIAGIWVDGIKTGEATVHHASNAATDQTIRFVIIG